jgi:periplasmic divalent cation tolerance protein
MQGIDSIWRACKDIQPIKQYDPRLRKQPMPTPHQLVLCTCPDQATAQNIAEQLVDRQLAACINILSGITSVYQWQGKRENSQEHLLLIKTTHAAYEILEQTLTNLHPYELPEIIAVPIARGSDAYLDWISQQVVPQSGST